jgi:hypothetical protein
VLALKNTPPAEKLQGAGKPCGTMPDKERYGRLLWMGVLGRKLGMRVQAAFSDKNGGNESIHDDLI